MAGVVRLICVCLCFSVVTCQFGFFPQREDRRYSSPLEWGANLLNPQNIRQRLTGVLHLQPENVNSNPNYIYPFRSPGIINENRNGFNPYQNPNQAQYQNRYQNEYQNQFQSPNQYQNPNQNRPYIQNGNGNFVAFPTPSQVNFPDNTNSNLELTHGQTNQGNFNGQNPFREPKSDDSAVIFEDGSTGSNGIPTIPPNNIPNANPNPGLIHGESNFNVQNPFREPKNDDSAVIFEDGSTGANGIPTVPPNEIPRDPPQGIPVMPPNGTPDAPSATPEPKPELTALTPVPESEKRNNYNFGPAGIFRETCETVDQQLGSCINIYSCQPYLYILQESRNNPQAVQILRRAHCGFEGNNPKVCCPRQGIPNTPPPEITTTTTTAAPPLSPKATGDDFVASFPEPPVCGVSNASFSRVVGGVKAKLGDFPWMAVLGYRSRRNSGARWLCGGSIITTKHILTAAHCIHNHEEDLFLVRVGELDLEREDEGATPVDVLIKTKYKHENYSPTAYTNDIGVLVLETHLTYTDLIKPICIPKTSELRSMTFESYNPIIAGWGQVEFRGPSASHLQALQLPVVSNEFCMQAYAPYPKQKIDERVLCAGYKKGGKDACQGDSGGPLMQPIWNDQDYTTRFYQIGVVSYGKKCAEPGFPGVYSRITYFIPWLEEKVLGRAA